MKRFLLASVLSFATACSTAAPTPTATPMAGGAVVGQHGMVVSANVLASEVGRRVLQTGGNAVDAAIATGFALAVVHPTAGNIGGGGFMVIRFPDGQTTAFNFREKAPLRSHPEMFLDENGEYSRQIHHNSHIAVGVPGTVAGFALAHERYGNVAWRRLVNPSVALAKNGFELTAALARSFASVSTRMTDYPASMFVFTKDGAPYEEGDLWVQPDLGRTLERIAEHGHDGFYRGETARLLALEMRRNGGFDHAGRSRPVSSARTRTNPWHIPRLRRDIDVAAE